jgi:predicted CoA-substrate-specific enzyme activase
MINVRPAPARFLEVIAKALGVELEELGTLSQQTQNEVKISSMCTVFAETEVVSLVASNTPIPDIVGGVHNSIANRAEILLNKVGIVQPIAMSGGVANNIGMVTELERRLNTKLQIAENPQIVGALGAAIIARKMLEKRSKKRATTPN